MIETQPPPQAWQTQRPPRILGLPLVAWLVALIVACLIGGVLYVLGSSTPTLSLPAVTRPPQASGAGASQTTPQIGSNQITTTALYRSTASPAAVIAHYLHVLPDHGGKIGRFTIPMHSVDPAALPTALPDLPHSFAANADYTFTEYSDGANDVGIAVDLRHPQGPTLVYVEMLSN